MPTRFISPWTSCTFHKQRAEALLGPRPEKWPLGRCTGSFTKLKVDPNGPAFSLRARLSRHLFSPPFSLGGQARSLSSMAQGPDPLHTERVCKEPGPR